MNIIRSFRIRSLGTMVGVLLAVLVVLVGGTASAAPLAATFPPGFSDTLVATVVRPTALTFTPDGRMLITTQNGMVRVYQNGALLAAPALDISADVCNNRDNGLVGIAVDPQFATNHYIYVYYTFNKTHAPAPCPRAQPDKTVNQLVRFTLSNNNTVDPTTKLVLLDNIPSVDATHNGGDVHFGKDGYLYVTVGDGACYYANVDACGRSNRAAQELNTLLGKIVRITSTGSVPPTNPYQGSGTARCNTGNIALGVKCQEIFAYGLRHPFRMAFDPNATGTRFFINDVGQTTWEEIDEGQAGANYGWNVREGHCAGGSKTDCGTPPTGMTNPIYDYQHNSDGAGAITGGAFVPNGVWSTSYNGVYLYSDYVYGSIYTLRQANGGYTATPWVTGLGTSGAVHMEFGPDGATQSLYYTTFAQPPDYRTGYIHRLRYTGGSNRVPTAVASATPTSGSAPLSVAFDGRGSSDPDAGDTLTYDWDFGDGSAHSTASTPSHTYTRVGTFTATLTVRDNHGAASAPVTLRIDVGNTPPTPTITAPTTSKRYRVGETITLQGSATDAQDGTEPSERLTWGVLLHHNTHTHVLLPATTGNNIPFQAPAPEDIDSTSTSYLEIVLTAADAQGLTSVVTQTLLPHKINIQFATEPSGLMISVNGAQFTGPHTLVSWESYILNVAAPDQQNAAGQAWVFDHWSDNGARSHNITTPANDVVYTAVFRPAATPTPSATATTFTPSATPTTVGQGATPTATNPVSTGTSQATMTASTTVTASAVASTTRTPQASASATPSGMPATRLQLYLPLMQR